MKEILKAVIENMESNLVITANREDHSVGLTGKLFLDGFSGFGEGWHSNNDVSEFCKKILLLTEEMKGKAELIGAQSKGDGSDYLERFSIRIYPLDSSKLNGIVGIHVTLSEYPYTDCRSEEILKVSGEFKTRNHTVARFAEDLSSLMSGALSEVRLSSDIL